MADMKMCPYCGEYVKLEAIKCKHCQAMLNKEERIYKRIREPAKADPTVEYLRERDRKKEIEKGVASLITVVILVALGIYLYPLITSLGDIFTSGERRESERVEQAKTMQPAYTISAKDLSQEYRNNEVAADDKYKGEIISVWGTVDRITTGTFDDDIIMYLEGNVRLRIADDYRERVKELMPGDEISISGECNGMLVGSVSIRGVIILDQNQEGE